MPVPMMHKVCMTCGEDWVPHLKLALTRLNENMTSLNPEREMRYVRLSLADIVDEHVDLLDCVEMLKLRNQGPPGPVGAMGMNGKQARLVYE